MLLILGIPRTPRRSTPCKPAGGNSQATERVINVVDDDGHEDEAVPPKDDENARLFPEFVDKYSKKAMGEDPAGPTQFDLTGEEERQENADMLVPDDEKDGEEDLPQVEWDRVDLVLAVGMTFKTMEDCRIAVTSFCIRYQKDFTIEKSEPRRLTVHCPYERCRWRLNAVGMRKKSLIPVLYILYFNN